jgi:hypothetical protein
LPRFVANDLGIGIGKSSNLDLSYCDDQNLAGGDGSGGRDRAARATE